MDSKSKIKEMSRSSYRLDSLLIDFITSVILVTSTINVKE